jgi:hypothetical protein
MYKPVSWVIVLERDSDGFNFFGTYEQAIALYPKAYAIERER